MRIRSTIVVGAVAMVVAMGILTQPAAHADGPYAYGIVEDKAFAQCLNTRYLGKAATAQISAAQLAGLTEFVSCYNFGIASIKGAEYLTGIVGLFLNGNTEIDASGNVILYYRYDKSPLSDLSPVAHLDNLFALQVDNYQVRDIAPLAGLIDLGSLSLQCNQVSDLSPLIQMSKLSTLLVPNNRISDVSPLVGLMPHLNSLVLSINTITDLSPLEGLVTSDMIVENRIDLTQQGGDATGEVMYHVPARIVLPGVTIGTYQLPMRALSTDPVTSVTLDPISPARTMSVDLNTGTIKYGVPGIYKINWRSASGKFTGTYRITVNDVPGTMYRIFNLWTGEHFYTSSMNEVVVNVNNGGWVFEGIGWVAPTSGDPVYRLAAIPGSGSAGHLFTTSAKERDVALASRNPAGMPYWLCETGAGMPDCVGWYSGGSVPVYRAFYPGNGQHNYTTDSNEQRVITTQQGWNDEKIGWTGVQKGNSSAPMPALIDLIYHPPGY